MEVDRILFPIDFTWSLEHTEKMVLAAKEMAVRFGAHLVVLFVVADLKLYARLPVPHTSLGVLRDEIVAEAEKRMGRFQFEYFEDAADTAFEVRVGDPVEEILKAAKDEGAGLVIMGTHGRRGLEHALVGSITELVIRSCPVPVLCLRLD